MRRLPAAIAILLAVLPARAADGWTFRPANGGSAGLATGGGYRGLWFACAGDGARLAIGTGGTRLQRGVDQTAVVTVDGTAFLQIARAASENGEPVLVRALPAAEFRQLADALGKGKKAEVATPAGRFALPLAGSSKALRSLLAACG